MIYMVQQGSFGERRFFRTKKSAEKIGGTITAMDVSENERLYRVHISQPGTCPTDFNAAIFKCKSKAEAERKGREYIRRWELVGEVILGVFPVAIED